MKPLHLALWLVSLGIYTACKQPYTTPPTIDTPDYKKGESLLDQHPDSAFYYFNRVATSSKDSLLIAKSYNYMAVIQSDAGDYYGSEESLLTSLKYLKEQAASNQNCLVSDYNELGRNSAELKNYEASIYYYDQAIKRSKRQDYKAIALNNQAVSYQKLGNYTKAIAIYRSIIEDTSQNRLDYARALTNLAITQWTRDSRYSAAPELLKALRIRKNENDDWGLNASYAHLSDYYAHKNPDSALVYAKQMYAVAQHLKSPDDQLEALQKLIALSPSKSTKQYFSLYYSLSDSVQTARNAAKNQFALIRYEAQKSKADNLRLQKDVIHQQIVIYSIIASLILVAGILMLWYRKRQQQMAWEAQNALHEHRLKTSQKVHDVVANGLYRVISGLEHEDNIDKGQLLDKLEILYGQSRDISYEKPQDKYVDFHEVIANLLGNFANEATKVLSVGNNKALWSNVTDHIKQELELVLQELMINMKKHSSAQNVVVRFERQGKNLAVQYTDDGVGLPPAFQYGNGLTSTGSRILRIGGRISFDDNLPKGLRINVYIPNVHD